MSSLTFDLIVRPRRGWQRLAADSGGYAQPLLSTGPTAAASIALAFVGAILSGATVGQTTVILLATTGGYVGACVFVARLAPVLAGDGDPPPALARCASAAAVPALATGAAYLTPWKLIWWLVALLGCALTARSAVLGARTLLRAAGGDHLRTAAIVAALASAPVLAVTAFRSIA